MTLHADAVRVLTEWTAPDAQQEALRQEYLDYLGEHPDGLWRTSRPAHLTASALLMDQVNSRVLLTLHAKLGRWLQLGGHCEPPDASLAAAAEREACEESGLADLRVVGPPLLLDRHQDPCGLDGSTAYHLDVQYLVPVGAARTPVANAESLQLRWWPAHGLPPDTDDSVRALVQRALATSRPGS